MSKQQIEAEVDSKAPLKIKKKPGRPKKLSQEKKVTKLEIKKDAVSEQSTRELDENKQTKDVEGLEKGTSEPRLEEITKEVENKDLEVINEKPEIVEEAKNLEKEVKEAVRDEKVSGRQLPENVEKLVNFMSETGGTVEDYVTLNKDYTKYDDKLLVKEYYKKTRPHLDEEEISFLMEDNFTFDEEADEERFVRKQKLAYKEEVAKAKNFLEQMKSKYYDEIKLRPSVTNEQKKAMDFFQRYNNEQQQITQKRSDFVNNTKSYFQEQFKGFEFNVGEKSFRYNVSNPSEMANAQSDVSKFISKFTNKEGDITDLDGYHKAIYAARNSDRLAQHFYEQGKADATRDVIAKSKNISNEVRPVATESTMPNGWKVKAITGVDSSRLKIKKKS
jgi:hypothetical protein|tara:strand:+ start:2837 stop:4003 length:1167 start_codon:yes stop_codon:yes gene_type:complete